MSRSACVRLVVAVLAVPAAPSASFDLNGDWKFSTSNHRIQGVCPPGSPLVTHGTIVQSGSTVALDLDAGMLGNVCSPAAMCQLDGSVAGTHYDVANGPIVVDDEGGVSGTHLVFEASSSLAASGNAVQTYALDAFVCTWTYDVDLERVPEPEVALAFPVAALALSLLGRPRAA